MINPDDFLSVLHGLAFFAAVSYILLWKLVGIGLRLRFPREWALDQKQKRLRWQNRRARLRAKLGL